MFKLPKNLTFYRHSWLIFSILKHFPSLLQRDITNGLLQRNSTNSEDSNPQSELHRFSQTLRKHREVTGNSIASDHGGDPRESCSGQYPTYSGEVCQGQSQAF